MSNKLPTKAKRPALIVIIIAVVLGAIAIWARFSRQLAEGDSPGHIVSLIAIALLIVALIVGGLYLHVSRAQKAQRRAVTEREPNAIVFGSSMLSAVAAFVKGAIPALGLGEKPKVSSFSSPTGVIGDGGFRLFHGGGNLKLSYAIPRDRIAGLTVGEVQEGIYTYATLGIAVTHPEGTAIIPVPVMRAESPMRRESPAGVRLLAEAAAAKWSVPLLDDLPQSAPPSSHS